jgi:hypothetical protein
MDFSPSYKQEHASLTVEELEIENRGSNDTGTDIRCLLLYNTHPTEVDYSAVTRVDYTWTSDQRVTVHRTWLSLTEELNKTRPPVTGETLTQTTFDFLHNAGMPNNV